MRIGVNTRLLIKNKLDGIGWHQYEVLKRVTVNHPEHQYFFFFDRPFDSSFVFSKNVTPIVLRPQARHPVLFKIWFNLSLKKALKKYGIDLFYSPDGYLSLTTKVKQIATFHDLNFEHYPGDLSRVNSKYYRVQFPLFSKKASHIITVSEFSKTDIIEKYKVDPNKITVIYNGVNTDYRPLSQKEKEDIREKFTDGAAYFLHVGSLHPRKNISRLISAFDLYKKTTQSTIKLVLAGNRYDWTNEMEKAFQQCSSNSDIVFTERLVQKDMVLLMGGAVCLTYVSYFEGFGMPIIEAMRSGTPVITSNCTAIPEIAGNAALLIDPFNTAEITNAMVNIYSKKELRDELIKKGLKQADKFSWDKSAERTWEVIQNTVTDAPSIS